MKEIKIIKGDDGMISVESTGEDGAPITTEAASIDEAIEQIKGEFGGAVESEGENSFTDDMGEGVPVEEMPPEGGGMVSASKGKKFEDKMPIIDKKKMGMLPKQQADWRDYGA